MQRQIEPELMLDQAQAQAYAAADFSSAHDLFVSELVARLSAAERTSRVADLGCGAADICVRLAERLPELSIDGFDGSPAMLACGQERLRRHGLTHRVQLYERKLRADTSLGRYDGIVSNSLLHHLHDPSVLWSVVRGNTKPAAWLFVMDLVRPSTQREAHQVVAAYAAQEPPILQHDFFHSLCAAFSLDEVREQLTQANLSHLTLKRVSDRHFVVCGPVWE